MKNTRAKGDEFENRTLEIVQRLIGAGKFFFESKNYKVFCQKGYHSKDRNKEIKVDVSIELFVGEADEYSLLCLLECKNYNSPISVGKVEEFKGKVDQISGKNVKACMVTTHSYQSGAVDYAKANGIALIRVLPDNQVKWDVYRSSTRIAGQIVSFEDSNELDSALQVETYEGKRNFFFGANGNSKYSSVTRFFSELLNEKAFLNISDKEFWLSSGLLTHQEVQIPYLDDDDLDRIATGFLSDISTGLLDEVGEVDILAVVEAMKIDMDCSFCFDEHLGKNHFGDVIIGRLAFNPSVINVSPVLEYMSPRWKFTLAHEIGHFILHRQLLDDGEHVERSDGAQFIEPSFLFDQKKVSLLELQANKFAAAMLLPRDHFLAAFLDLTRLYQMTPKGFGYIYLDRQPWNITDYLKVIGPLESTFRVSREVAKIRLKRFGLLTEEEPKKIQSGRQH